MNLIQLTPDVLITAPIIAAFCWMIARGLGGAGWRRIAVAALCVLIAVPVAAYVLASWEIGAMLDPMDGPAGRLAIAIVVSKALSIALVAAIALALLAVFSPLRKINAAQSDAA